MLKKSALALATTATLLLAGCDDNGTTPEFVMYVTDGDALFVVNGSNPLIADRLPLSGLNAGTQLYALDVNPKGGALNGLGSDGQAYLINVQTGAVEKKGTPDNTVVLTDRAVEMDYNPTVPNQQVYRYVTSTGDNIRRNDTTGAKVGTDSAFTYRTGDVNAGKSVVVSGIAYTNSQLNTAVPASTTVYAVDTVNDTLTVLGGNPANGAACPNDTNPNCGQLTTVGPVGFDASGYVGFDILGANTAYAVTFANGSYNLYTVNLAASNTPRFEFKSIVNPGISIVRAFAVQQK